jgi:hypothetical protein
MKSLPPEKAAALKAFREPQKAPPKNLGEWFSNAFRGESATAEQLVARAMTQSLRALEQEALKEGTQGLMLK